MFVDRVSLVKEVPTTLPARQAVGIVHHAFRADQMINGTVGIPGVFLARFGKTQDQRFVLQLFLLFRSMGGEGILRGA
jgi:hypothetical protein